MKIQKIVMIMAFVGATSAYAAHCAAVGDCRVNWREAFVTRYVMARSRVSLATHTLRCMNPQHPLGENAAWEINRVSLIAYVRQLPIDQKNQLLWAAAFVGFFDGAQLAIQSGADIFSVDMNDNTALNFAINGRDKDLVLLLLQNDAVAVINKKNNSEITPLHMAVEFSLIDIVTMLLQYRARVNVQDADGMTPLHYAVFSGSWSADIVRLLIQHGANVHAKTKAGAKPSWLAFLAQKRSIYELLVTEEKRRSSCAVQ